MKRLLLIIDLPLLASFTTGQESFYKTTSVIINSIKPDFFIFLDIPFANGQYTHGESSFYRLQTNSVYHDDSSVYISLLL